MSTVVYVVIDFEWCVFCVCSVRPSTVLEEFAVPDSMIGLSEYIHSPLLNHPDLFCVLYVYNFKLFLLFLKSLAKEVNK